MRLFINRILFVLLLPFTIIVFLGTYGLYRLEIRDKKKGSEE